MRLVAIVCILIVAFSGCVVRESAATGDCRTGSGEFFILVDSTPGFGPPENQYLKLYRSLDREGDLFSFQGHATSGSGRVLLGPKAAFNLTADEIRRELVRIQADNVGSDYNVSMAFRDRVSPSDFAGLCRVVLQEWIPPQKSGLTNSCVDGGEHHFRFSTSKGLSTRRGGCTRLDAAEEESVRKIESVFWPLVGRSAQKLGAST